MLALLLLGLLCGGASASAKVSVIMPTRGRPERVRHALDSIDLQTYDGGIEIIVVDDSAEALRLPELRGGATTKAGHAVVYLELEKRTSNGSKRNQALQVATGSVLVHWDDDGIFAPGRIAAQVNPIHAGEADVTIMLGNGAPSGAATRLRSARSTPPLGLHFGTLAYSSPMAFWMMYLESPDANQEVFADTSVGEDYRFVQDVLSKLGATVEVISSNGEISFTDVSFPDVAFIDSRNKNTEAENRKVPAGTDFDLIPTLFSRSLESLGDGERLVIKGEAKQPALLNSPARALGSASGSGSGSGEYL
jgi:glycosyltransferase involved in cell wall biosynthesis